MVTDESLRCRLQNVHEQTRNHDGVSDNVVERQVDKQKVHGLVETAVEENQDRNADIGQYYN